MPAIYIGLGPNGRQVTADQLRDLLGQCVRVQEVRCRGTFAFVDVESDADAQALIAAMNHQYVGDCRMALRIDHPRGAVAADARDGPVTLFVGLGPQGSSVADAELEALLAAAAPILAMRRNNAFTLVDVASGADADRVIAKLNGAMVGPCRLSVRYGKESSGHSGRGGRGGNAPRTPHYSTRAPTTGGGARGGPATLFVGLGPRSGGVNDGALRSKLEEAAPILGVRRHAAYALVDVASGADAERVIAQLNGAMVGPCRLSIRYDRESS